MHFINFFLTSIILIVNKFVYCFNVPPQAVVIPSNRQGQSRVSQRMPQEFLIAESLKSRSIKVNVGTRRQWLQATEQYPAIFCAKPHSTQPSRGRSLCPRRIPIFAPQLNLLVCGTFKPNVEIRQLAQSLKEAKGTALSFFFPAITSLHVAVNTGCGYFGSLGRFAMWGWDLLVSVRVLCVSRMLLTSVYPNTIQSNQNILHISTQQRCFFQQQDHLAVKTHAVSQLRCVLHGCKDIGDSVFIHHWGGVLLAKNFQSPKPLTKLKSFLLQICISQQISQLGEGVP